MKHMKTLMLMLISLMLALIVTSPVHAQDYYGENPMDELGAALGVGALSTMCCFLIFLPLIIGLLIGIWVYKDAEKRGKSGALWFIIVWITFPIGLIIWFIVRPPIGGPQTTINQTIQQNYQQQSSDRRCPSCGRGIPNDARVCPYCGKNFESH